MAKSPDAVRAERINAALALLQKRHSLAEAATSLVRIFGMSKRQAYRYLREAQKRQHPVPMPERKVAFTVKLSESLVHDVRERARLSGLTLSELVSKALDTFMHKGRRGGDG
jgi:catalase (peroxidase I)